MATLYWVSLASRPLSVTEISHALAVRTDSAKNPFDISRVCSRNTLLACCMGLVVIDEETSTVRLVHYSLQEFLQNGNDLEVSLFHIHTGHGLIAKTCLTYLRFCQSMTLEMAASCECQKRYGGKKIWWEDACTCRSEFPLFSYASLEWGNHVREGYDTSIGSLAVEWLTAKETASCPCAIMYMSLVRDKYRYSSYPDHWYSYRTSFSTPCHHSLLVLHGIAYFGAQILEEMATTVSQLELNVKDKQGWTALTWAAARGHDLCVKQLLKYREAEVAIVDVFGVTPLMHAALHGNTKVVKQLLALDNSRRGNLNAYSMDGRTAISYAAGRGHCAITGILLHEAEVDPNYTGASRTTPLMYASQEGMTNTVKALLSDHRVTPTLQDGNGDTALHLAVQARAVEVLKLLLQDPRVDPNHKGMDDYTPLAFAAESGHTEILKLLLGDLRVDPNHESRDSYTPLALAAKSGHAEVVKLLLRDSRVDPNPVHSTGNTLLISTKEYLCRDNSRYGRNLIDVLLTHPRVDPNVRDSGGRTALSYLVAGDFWLYRPWSPPEPQGVDIEVVKSLLEGSGGADPNIRDNEGKTALDWALSVNLKNSDKCRELLQKYMSPPPQTGDVMNNINKRKVPPPCGSAPAKYPKLE